MDQINKLPFSSICVFVFYSSCNEKSAELSVGSRIKGYQMFCLISKSKKARVNGFLGAVREGKERSWPRLPLTKRPSRTPSLQSQRRQISSYYNNTTLTSSVKFTGAEGLAGCRLTCSSYKLCGSGQTHHSVRDSVSSSVKRGDAPLIVLPDDTVTTVK